MNLYMKFYLLVVLTIFSLVVNQKGLLAQGDLNTNTRTVIITTNDQIIKAEILIHRHKIKIDTKLKYYWYNNRQIGFNRGGINGKALHGSYSVCDKDGLLIKQGEFEYGLKTGKWKVWYKSGELESEEIWKDGLLNGDVKRFSRTGELLSLQKIRKGKEIVPQESFLKKIFHKTESCDSTQNISENNK